MSTANSEHTDLAAVLARRSAALATWLVLATLICLAVARISVWIQEAGFASMLLPLVLGGAIGTIIVGLARAANESCRTRLLIAAVVLAMVCVLAEHLFFYFDYRAQFAASAAKNPSVQIFQTAGGLEPASFPEFLGAGAQRSIGMAPGWVWWIIDAGLTIVAGAAAVVIFHRVSPSDQTAKP